MRSLFDDGPFINVQLTDDTPLIGTGFQNIWTGTVYTPIYANDPKVGKTYCIRAFGVLSTAAASKLTISPTISGLNALGDSQQVTLPANMTNVPWRLKFDLTYRTIGAAGANSTCIGVGTFVTGVGTLAGQSAVIMFGGTVATCDATIDRSFFIQKLLSVAGSWTTKAAYIFTRN